MPIQTLTGATHVGEVVGYHGNELVYLWPVDASYFSTLKIDSSVYAWIDYGNTRYPEFRLIRQSVTKITHYVRSAEEHAARTAQLWSGDVVFWKDDERKMLYVGPTVLKDSFGNLVDVEPGSFFKLQNGRKTEPHRFEGTDLYRLAISDHPSKWFALVDSAYDMGVVTDSDMPILMTWVNNDAPFIL